MLMKYTQMALEIRVEKVVIHSDIQLIYIF